MQTKRTSLPSVRLLRWLTAVEFIFFSHLMATSSASVRVTPSCSRPDRSNLSPPPSRKPPSSRACHQGEAHNTALWHGNSHPQAGSTWSTGACMNAEEIRINPSWPGTKQGKLEVPLDLCGGERSDLMKMHVKTVVRSECRLEGRGIFGGRDVFRFVWNLLQSCSPMAEQQAAHVPLDVSLVWATAPHTRRSRKPKQGGATGRVTRPHMFQEHIKAARLCGCAGWRPTCPEARAKNAPAMYL